MSVGSFLSTPVFTGSWVGGVESLGVVREGLGEDGLGFDGIE